MARQKLELLTCDRCKREQLRPVPDQEKVEADFSMKFKGDDLVYKDLCTGCEKTVRNLIQELKEWDRKINSLLDEKVAPPLEVPPSYTPPKPHSPGAVKK
jgi:hypothetical protein